jgi:hypothetical protein
MSSDALERIVQTVNALSSEYSKHRVQIDELYYLIDICENDLPTQFIDLVKDAHSKTGTSASIFETRKKRMQGILDIASKFPKQPQIVSDDLMPTFKLNENDKKRVLKLCGDIRKIVFSSNDFDDPHKKRLLNRIAAIEKQVYSPKGLFDVVLGGVSDIGETVGKFGKDIKPLTDRIEEIKRITRKNSSAYDQLPEPEELKKLPAPEDTPDEPDA